MKGNYQKAAKIIIAEEYETLLKIHNGKTNRTLNRYKRTV